MVAENIYIKSYLTISPSNEAKQLRTYFDTLHLRLVANQELRKPHSEMPVVVRTRALNFCDPSMILLVDALKRDRGLFEKNVRNTSHP
ncbi:MAG: hypothetical protein ABL921_15260 [Pirellula sp.]